jgi:amino acid exporter
MSAHLLGLTSLLLVTTATALVPGPTNFLTMRLGMRRGRGAALFAALGTTAGCILWCAAAALGLAAALTAAPWLYKILKVGGGLYLVWFAIALWRSKSEPQPDRPTAGGAGTTAFWQAFAICLTNPKSVLFFASIFSAYVGPDSPLWAHAAAVAVVVATCLFWNVALALAFSSGRAAQAYARAQRPLDRGAAVLMGGFGAGLLWTGA